MNLPLEQFQRPEPSSVAITKLLVNYLLSGQIAPGSRVPSERALADTLGAGRSAVREALKSLVLLGVLDSRQGDGTYLARTPSDLLPEIIGWGLMLGDRNVSDLIETRTHLEVTLAGLAADRRTEEQLANLSRIITEMATAGEDLEEYIQADVRFHSAIAESSGNKVMIGMHHSVGSLLRVWTSRVIRNTGNTRNSLALHRPVFEAIRLQDADAARDAMTTHMQTATRHLLSTMKRGDTTLTESPE